MSGTQKQPVRGPAARRTESRRTLRIEFFLRFSQEGQAKTLKQDRVWDFAWRAGNVTSRNIFGNRAHHHRRSARRRWHWSVPLKVLHAKQLASDVPTKGPFMISTPKFLIDSLLSLKSFGSYFLLDASNCKLSRQLNAGPTT